MLKKSNPKLGQKYHFYKNKITLKAPLFKIIEHMSMFDDIDERIQFLNSIRKTELNDIKLILSLAYGEFKFNFVNGNIDLNEWNKNHDFDRFSISTIHHEINRIKKFTDDKFNIEKIGYIANTILGGFEEIPVKDAMILQAILQNNFYNKYFSPELADKIGIVVKKELLKED